jgi:hypothetical protein
MFNVCPGCGEYRADKTVDPTGAYAVCPLCGHRQPFLRLPLLIVSGASGTGKSTVCLALLGRLTNVVLLECDLLWRAEFDRPETNYREFFELWLRLCKSIGQSGRPVVLFGAGAGVPANIEPCVERRYFSGVHYLALTCDGDVLAQRLRRRPAWRASGSAAFVEGQLAFNRWFIEKGPHAERPVDLLDTTGRTVQDTADAVAAWIGRHVGGAGQASRPPLRT